MEKPIIKNPNGSTRQEIRGNRIKVVDKGEVRMYRRNQHTNELEIVR